MSDIASPSLRADAERFRDPSLGAMVAVMLAVSLASLDTAIANTALPAIARDLRSASAQAVWIINAYQLSMIATLFPFAAFGDALGHKKTFSVGLFVFVAASLACALSPTLLTLAISRCLQGVGASAIVSVSIALVRSLYPPHQLGRAVGTSALVVGVSVAVGPTLTSLVLSVASWPWLFAINVPLGLMALGLATRCLPQIPGNRSDVDLTACVLSMATFSMLTYALCEAAQRGDAVWTLGALSLSITFGALLLLRERGHHAPILPVDLFRRPAFALSAFTAVCAFAAQGLAFVSLPFYFEDVLHRSQIETGFLITPWPVVVALVAPVAGRMSDRYAPAVLGGGGLVILGVGLASLALMPSNPGTLDIVLRMAICGVGFGFFQSPNMKALMSSAPTSRSGTASGVVSTARLLGQTTGAALVALSLGAASHEGAFYSLLGGSAFALVGSIASVLRLLDGRAGNAHA